MPRPGGVLPASIFGLPTGRKGLYDSKAFPGPNHSDMNRPFPALAVFAAVSLGGAMQPGDYILQTIVTDKLAKSKRNLATQFVQFEIIK